ncbi:hypothetical protein C8P68_101116 [Mucilaginibacter yixingensis]|uniref:Outer membrane protein with beta-barrel domain n=1 Tax=Mucilaginibacter yixingensis TaxID=1295612 RepID=A0A2T5JEM6_9SPHI|nr:hypothetical protein [Mucilaginibacter yixingensis]PTR00887.1 hypothetical protein C8P68_101116 [Mucilaginibacter yixingensis]
MKKYFLLAMLFCGFCRMACAQDDHQNHTALSAGPEISFPSRSQFNFGYGGSLKFETPVAQNVGLSLTGAYTEMIYKGVAFAGGTKPSPAGFVPLKAGVVYYAGGARLEGEVGSVLEQQEINGVKQNLFTFSLGPSFLIPLADSKQQFINVGLRYESWSKNTLRMIGIRVAYHLNFKSQD